MKNNRSIKRRGFTLVELLIVIVVIGVLSAMMMLSSTEAVSSAKASNIVSNLRNLKTAALAWYADNLDSADAVNIEGKRDQILKYMNNENVPADYKFTGKGANNWFVYVNNSDTNVGLKLVGRKNSVGLWIVTAGDDAKSADLGTTGTGNVGMFIR